MEEVDFEPQRKHEFKDMKVGELIQSKPELQRYVHAYGCNSGKKFATKTIKGVMFVKRIK